MGLIAIQKYARAIILRIDLDIFIIQIIVDNLSTVDNHNSILKIVTYYANDVFLAILHVR